MDLEAKLQNLVGAEKLLSLDVDNILKTSIFDIAGFQENRATKYLKVRVYGQPASPNYRRTGGALGGHTIKREGAFKAIVIFDARLKNKKSKVNYTLFLNRNRRIKKLNTKFHDDAVKETTMYSGTALRLALKKELKKRR